MLTAIMDGKFKIKSTCSFIFVDKCRLTLLSLVAFARLRTKTWSGGWPNKYSTFVQLAFCYPLVNINLWRSYHPSSTYGTVQYDLV
jgi:hypothetical protein